jgi:hypothetical protein
MKKFVGVCLLVGGIVAAVWCFTAADRPEIQARDFAGIREQNEREAAQVEAEQPTEPEPARESVHVEHTSIENTDIANLPVRQTSAGRSLSRDELEFFVAAENEQRAREPETAAAPSQANVIAQPRPSADLTTQSAEFQEFVAMAQQLAATKSLSELRAQNSDGTTTLSPEAKALADRAVGIASQFLTPEQTQKLQDLESNPDAMRKLGKAASRVLGSRAGQSLQGQ